LNASPKNIKLAGAHEAINIEWADGHLSVYPYRYLRDRCPCATCAEVGPPSSRRNSPFPMLGVKPLKPDRAELVGRYALQIFWNDGHSSGIYSFDFLRQICPCEECAGARQDG
jgi:DUF971 family protein